ncbi:LPXTG cell wall anchor domain-containing protein [Pediococcus pentosaceus]|uniref:LPXTG cell wall anchor domain-containing protein n=1 Tax=Pediococcus pentosaceus TaxID=1255 RepID=UPI004039DF87
MLQQSAATAKKALADAQAKLAQLEYQKEINDAIDGKNDNTNKPIDNSNDNKDSNTESVNDSNDNQIDNNETTVDFSNEVVNSGLITNNLAHTRATVITPAMVASKSLSNNKNSQAAKKTLPQTNEEGGQTASILGLMMIGIVGIFGTAKKRERL